MNESIKIAIMQMIAISFGLLLITKNNVYDREFDIKGSSNNPHIMMEDGSIFNCKLKAITDNDLRLLVYDGVCKKVRKKVAI